MSPIQEPASDVANATVPGTRVMKLEGGLRALSEDHLLLRDLCVICHEVADAAKYKQQSQEVAVALLPHARRFATPQATLQP